MMHESLASPATPGFFSFLPIVLYRHISHLPWRVDVPCLSSRNQRILRPWPLMYRALFSLGMLFLTSPCPYDAWAFGLSSDTKFFLFLPHGVINICTFHTCSEGGDNVPFSMKTRKIHHLWQHWHHANEFPCSMIPWKRQCTRKLWSALWLIFAVSSFGLWISWQRPWLSACSPAWFAQGAPG